MPAISAVIICKNEEKNIARCLDSLQGLADEIIVLDGFSSDATEEICKRFGVRFIQEKWSGYSKTKNFANSQASHPYILSIDADEALSGELKENILSIKNTLSGAYSFNRLNNYCGAWIKHSGWYPDIKIRLFEKARSEWKGEIHETLELHGQSITHLPGDLLHYSYYSVDEHYERARKYAELASDKLSSMSSLTLHTKRIFSPAVRFIRSLLIKKGFLDGNKGWTISKIAAWEVYLKYHLALLKKKAGQ